MIDIKKVADGADMIINGYAFTKEGEYVRTLNLDNPTKAAVFLNDEIVETTMDEIEMAITKDYYLANKKYMEN